MKEGTPLTELPPDVGLEALVAAEKLFLKQERRAVLGTGELPLVRLLDGRDMRDFVIDTAHAKGKVKILDIGAGDDCAAWTGGAEGSYFKQGTKDATNTVVRDLRNLGIEMEVTAQSGGSHYADFVTKHGVTEFLPGHFYDVLQSLRGRQFDVITTRMAMYQTVANIKLLQTLEDLLAEGGAAFTETISKIGNNRVLLYTKVSGIGESISTQDIKKTMTFKQAHVGALSWGVQTYQGISRPGNEAVAWKKGMLQVDKLPKLSHIAKADDIIGQTYYAIYYAAEQQ